MEDRTRGARARRDIRIKDESLRATLRDGAEAGGASTVRSAQISLSAKGAASTWKAFVITVVLVVAMLPLVAIPVGANAEENRSANEMVSLADAENPAEKQEVIYATLDNSGTVKRLYAVNVLKGESGTLIQDHGTYESVSNLTNTSEITHLSDAVLFEMPDEDFSYQGNLTSTDLPWSIAFTYRLDGQEVQAADLAGKSGTLEITLHTSQNPAVDARYFENYLIQATCTLPMDKVENVQTDDGSIALSGSDTTVNFMVMPGKDGEASLTAQVTDLEMPGISVAAIPFSMAIDAPDTGSLVSNFDALIEGADQLDLGTQQLAQGIDAVRDATRQAAAGAAEVAQGATQMSQGLAQYQQGLRAAADEAAGSVSQDDIAQAQENYKAALSVYAAAYAAEYERLMAAGDITSEEALKQAAANLSGSSAEQNMTVAMRTLVELMAASAGSQGAAQALDQAADGLGPAADTQSLIGGMAALDAGTTELAQGLDQLAGGTGDLSQGASSLQEGTAMLAQETQGIPDRIQQEIDAMMADYDKSDFQPASFTSSKNTNVTLVQFVMTTDAIEVPEPEQTDEPEQEETLIDRFFALFS
ncbi:MAG: hypothetical protein U0M72_08475 [Eggerthellaceae bacterium]